MTSYAKDSDAVLDYTKNWEPWLTDIDDTIATSTWTVPAGLVKDSEANTTTTATVWLSGGTAGARYRVVNHIVTAEGREDDRTITINVRDR